MVTVTNVEHDEVKIDIFKCPDGDTIIKMSNPNNEGSSILLSGRCSEELLQYINGFVKILSQKGAR